MLTYATVEDFLQMKDIGKTGLIVVSDTGKDKIDVYLERATRFIDRTTRRFFLPRMQTRLFSIPYAASDLRIRRFSGSHLPMDQDLLEIHSLTVNDIEMSNTLYFPIDHNILPYSAIAPRRTWNATMTSAYTRHDDAIINVTGIWGYAESPYPLEFWIDTGTVVPAGGLTAIATTMTVPNSSIIDESGHLGFAVGRMLKIDDEFIEITAVNRVSHLITMRRGVRGTTKAIHDEDAEIFRWRVIEDIVEVTLQVAKTWREADIAAGGRIGVSDVSTGAEIGIPSDPLKIINSYQRSML